VYTVDEFKERVKKHPKKSKMGNKPKVYNGVRYQSTAEAHHAGNLDFAIKAGLVERWERQISYKLVVNGVLITTYILDFRVFFTDGTIQYQDVKGRHEGVPYDLFTAKKNLMYALFSIVVIEI
jgi:hypothetical protein